MNRLPVASAITQPRSASRFTFDRAISVLDGTGSKPSRHTGILAPFNGTAAVFAPPDPAGSTEASSSGASASTSSSTATTGRSSTALALASSS